MSRRKKVKFADTVNARELSREEGLPSFQAEGVQCPTDDAKTSEYKSFRRLLIETTRKHNSSQLLKHGKNLIPYEESNTAQEKNDSFTCRSDGVRPLLPTQKVTPIAQRPPSANSLQNFELDNRSKYEDNSISVTPIHKVSSDCWKSSFSPSKSSLERESKPEYEGIFSKKRQNLLKLMAETSSHKVEEILKNKSEVILKFLQRLDSKPKLGNLDELPGENVTSDQYHSSTSLESSGDVIPKTARKDDKRTVRRKHEEDLLAYKCNETEKLLALPVVHFDENNLPTRPVDESDLHCQRWLSNSVSDGKGRANLNFEKKQYQNACHKLPEATGLSTWPGDYSVLRTLPASSVSSSALQQKKWHFDPVLDDGKVVGKRSASTRCYVNNHLFSEINAFARESVEFRLQGLRWKFDPLLDDEVKFDKNSAGTGYSGTDHLLPKMDELRWNSGSEFEEEGFLDKRLHSIEHHVANQMLPKADEILMPKEFKHESFPSRPAMEAGFLGKRKYSLQLLGETSSFDNEEHLISYDLGNEDEDSRCLTDPMVHRPSTLGYKISKNLPSTCQFIEQAIFPYNSSGSLDYLSRPDLYSELSQEKHTLPLLQWSDSSEPAKFSSPFSDKLPIETNHLPLTLYSPPDLLDKTCRSENNSFSLSSIGPLSTPKREIELEWNNVQVNNKKRCWSIYTNLQFGNQVDDGFNCFATRHGFDDRRDDKNSVGVQSHLPVDFPSLGLKFSLDREKVSYGFLPDRLSWQSPSGKIPNWR